MGVCTQQMHPLHIASTHPSDLEGERLSTHDRSLYILCYHKEVGIDYLVIGQATALLGLQNNSSCSILFFFSCLIKNFQVSKSTNSDLPIITVHCLPKSNAPLYVEVEDLELWDLCCIYY